MSNKQKQLQALLKEVVGDLSSKDQLKSLSQDLLKTIVETKNQWGQCKLI